MDGGKAQAGAHSASLRKANNKATLPCRRLWNTFGVQRNPTRACSYDLPLSLLSGLCEDTQHSFSPEQGCFALKSWQDST
jgi:hypothetical protein